MSNPPAGLGSSFPAASNVLQRRWNHRKYQMHVAKKNGMKTKVDATSPKVYPHLQVNMKKMQVEEERQAVIDHENRILLAKLTNIIRSGGQLDNWNFQHEAGHKILNAPFKNKEQEKIERENAALLKRLNHIKPSVNFDKMEDDYLMHNYFLAQKAQSTKNFEIDNRGVEEGDKFIFYATDRHAQKEKTFVVDGDIEETIEEPEEGEVTELASGKADATGNRKLPTRQKLKRRATKLPAIGAERKKAEEKKKKDAAVRPQTYNQKEEAAKLFKATKGMGNPEQILVQTLAKRTYQQRQDTLAKFEENYGLTLEEELKSNLSAEYDDIIDALLATREDLDATTLRRALKGEDSLVEPVIEIFCTRSNAAISSIKEAYKTKFGVTVEEDITAEIKGKLKHLFLALSKGCRKEDGDVDEEAAKGDAEALRDAESEERWSARSGKMSELLQEASLVHLREVLLQYDKLMSSNLEKELSRMLLGDFKDAMICLVHCMNSSTDYLADRIHASLSGEADEMTLIRIIVTRSEIDLPLIRRAYKRKYQQTLVESIEQRCQVSYKSALVQMVVVHGATQKTEQEIEQSASEDQPTKAGGNKTYQQKPLKKPTPNPGAKISSSNPLLKSTQQSSDPTRKSSGNLQRTSQAGGARSKQPTHGPGSPVKSRSGTTLKSREATLSGTKKTSTPPRKLSPSVNKTPKATPKESSKLPQIASNKTKSGEAKTGTAENKKAGEGKKLEKDQMTKEGGKDGVAKEEEKVSSTEDKREEKEKEPEKDQAVKNTVKEQVLKEDVKDQRAKEDESTVQTTKEAEKPSSSTDEKQDDSAGDRDRVVGSEEEGRQAVGGDEEMKSVAGSDKTEDEAMSTGSEVEKAKEETKTGESQGGDTEQITSSDAQAAQSTETSEP